MGEQLAREGTCGTDSRKAKKPCRLEEDSDATYFVTEGLPGIRVQWCSVRNDKTDCVIW